MTLYLFYKSLTVPGGAERLLIEEYKAFKALGYDVKLVVFRYKIDALFGEDIERDIINLDSRIWLIALFRFIVLLLRNRSSVVFSSSGVIEVYLACLTTNTDYSLHVHHPTSMNVEKSKYSFFMKDKYRYILKRSYEPEVIEEYKSKISAWSYPYISLRQLFDYLSMKSAKHIFVLSAYARNELKFIYGLDSEVVQGAIDTVRPNYKTVASMENIDDLKILCVSRLVPQKRIDCGIYAFSEVLKKLPSATLFVGGRGPEEIRLKKIVNDLNISTSVIFLGFISDDELLDYYSSADVFLSLDWADFNITVYEAISAGTKVIVSEEGEFDHELIGAGYIFRVNPKYIEAITQAIIKSQTVGEKLSNDHIERLLMPYTWTEYCKKIADIHGFRP